MREFRVRAISPSESEKQTRRNWQTKEKLTSTEKAAVQPKRIRG